MFRLLQKARDFIVPSGTSLPYGILIVMFTSRLINLMTTIGFRAYATNFVAFTGISWTEAAKYTGAIFFLNFICKAMAAVLFGHFADKWGMRKSYLLHLVITLLVTVSSCFATTMASLLIHASLFGMCSGMKTVSRALLKEISDKQSEAHIMTWVVHGANSIGWGFGPGLVGLLLPQSLERGKHSISPGENVMEQYPLLLPNGVLALFLSLMVTAAFFVLPKSLDNNINKKHVSSQKQSLVEKSDESEWRAVLKMFASRKCWMAWLMASLHNSLLQSYAIVFFSMLATPREKGGVGFNSKKVGSLMMTAGCLIVVCDFTVAGGIIRRLGIKWSSIGSLLGLVFLFSFTPNFLPIASSDVLWWQLMLNIGFARVLSTIEGSVGSLALNKSAPKGKSGLVNGIATFMKSAMTGITLFITGWMFSWSLKNDNRLYVDAIGFPFNICFSFYIIGLEAFIGAIFFGYNL